MHAADQALDVYRSAKTFSNLEKAEMGIYGLVSANGFSEYLTGKDMFGNELKFSFSGFGKGEGNIFNEVKEIDFGKHIIKGENGKKQLLPNTKYVTNDNYKYTTDELGRIVNVDAPELVLKKADRNKYAQANVGGPPDIDNLVPQNSQINRRGGVW